MSPAASHWRRLVQGPSALVAAVCLWAATVGNLALWRELHRLSLLQGAGGVVLVLGLVIGIAAASSLLLSVLVWRRTLKPALVLVLMVCAGASHFMLSFGVVLDPGMLVNVLQTDGHEAADLLNWRLAVHLLLLGGLPALWVLRRQVSFEAWPRRAVSNLKLAVVSLLLVVIAVLAAFQPLASAVRNHRELRYLVNPLNLAWALGHTAFAGAARPPGVQAIGLDAAPGHRFDPGHPPLLVLVLGETGRSGNFGLNGYARDTTPALAKQDVISWRDAWSCGTSTAASVPCMFSRLTRARFFDRPRDEEGLLDVLQRAGYAVLWVDNQSGCKGVCERVPHVSTDASAHPALCTDGECLDGVLLEGLDARLASLSAERRARGVVLVLHQMGSHGPAYHRRSPAQVKRFLPECTQSELQGCTQAELVNAYDNSIAYTDRVLADTIGWLQRQSAQWSPAMVYVADHGESLGENNLYLHGLPYAIAPEVQKRVPWVTWMSPRFEQALGLSQGCLREQRDRPLSHDHYFHSVLGLMDVQTAVYAPELDAYAACRHGRDAGGEMLAAQP